MKTVNADTVIFTAPSEGVATGRNGDMKVRGLRAWRSLDGKLVTLEPWTSRGQIGNCRIVVPTAELQQVTDMLKGMLEPETPALLDAAKGVLANWEHGDLAAAVRELAAAVAKAERSKP